MANSIKKRGQKIVNKFSRASIKASAESKEHIRENLIQRFSHIRNIRLLIVEWSSLIAALFLFGVAQAFWFGESYAGEVFVDGGTYAEATLGRVNSMNPLFATTSSEKVLSELMFATLAAVDYSGHMGPELAESITSSEDGQIWTVKLKDGLLWSDGEPLTVDDVMFTIELIQNPAANTIYDANLEGVKVRRRDDGKIDFTLPLGFADFISALDIPIVPKHILDGVPVKTLVEADFSNSPTTSGAFSFNAIQSTAGEDESIFYLSANPNYYLGKPMVNSFAVHTYPTKEAIIAAINSGAVTGTGELADGELNEITLGNYIVRKTPVNSGAFLFFNTSNPNLSKVAMRQAIRQGINFDAIRELTDGAMPLDYPILDNQITLSNYPTVPGYDFSAAKSAIGELTGGGRIRLNVTTVNSGFLPSVAQAICEQLRELGFDSDVVLYTENQEFVTNVISRRNYAILLYEIELGADPDLLPYYHSSQVSTAGLNLSNYRNSLVDDLLIGARDTLDEDLRAKKYESLIGYLAEDVPSIGLYQSDFIYIYNKNARVYGENVRLVTGMDRFSDITSWAVARGIRDKTP